MALETECILKPNPGTSVERVWVPPFYSSKSGARKLVLGASLAVLGLEGGPTWAQMGDRVCLDIEEIG